MPCREHGQANGQRQAEGFAGNFRAAGRPIISDLYDFSNFYQIVNWPFSTLSVEKNVYFKDKLTDTMKNFDTKPDFNIAGALRNAKRKLKNQRKSYASHSTILPKPPDTINNSLQEQDLNAANIVFNDLYEIGESVSEVINFILFPKPLLNNLDFKF